MSWKLTFMFCKVDKVMRCTSIAWIVAAMPLAFCSNQNCTVLSSWMRLSISLGSSVGATQPGTPVAFEEACGVRFFKKSKPGTNLVKSKALESVMHGLLRAGCQRYKHKPLEPLQNKSMLVITVLVVHPLSRWRLHTHWHLHNLLRFFSAAVLKGQGQRYGDIFVQR